MSTKEVKLQKANASRNQSRTSRESLALVTKQVQLESICLLGSYSFISDSKYPGEKTVRQRKVTIDLIETKPASKKFWVLFSLGIREVSQQSDSENKEELLIVTAEFKLAYTLENRKGINRKDLLEFARINAPFNVWPYWREFVQNTTMRMGIPPIVLRLRPPVFAQAVKQRTLPAQEKK